MKELNYPIGEQVFSEIVNGEWYYVDKTIPPTAELT